MRKILLLSLSFMATLAFGQTLEELKAKKAAIEAELAPIQAQVDPLKTQIADLDAQIAKFPGWYKGSFGTLGVNFTGLNNWIANPNPDSKSTTILGSFNAFANKLEDKYFWRNSGALNLGWQKLDTRKEGAPKAKFEPVSDLLNLTSLFGYKITKTLAASALGEYRTSVINNFNNPGYFDIGVGATWTPVSNLVVVFHPLNYNFIFADDNTQYTSSLGCKIVADYNATLYKGVKWRSNLSSFLSYKNSDPSLSNHTFTNGFSFTLVKGIGVGIQHAFRINRQESLDNQQYFILGLSYAL
ncbi:MAG: DUF3078 domain-containing protein [Saprospiraceae bacterium]|nr:DUF3078 domain-containing protein [Saprospiraceae bacterium]MBP7643685.1 DUF3078 domain-containing protein [Saprospiraceae bacterium]